MTPRTVAWAWLVHGILVVVLALMLEPMADQVQSEAWADAMSLLGAGTFIPPLQAVMPPLAALAPLVAGVGAACVMAAVVAFRWGLRWPLQTVAVAHLVLPPLATWWTRRQVEAVWPATTGELVAEWVTTVLCLVPVVVGMVVIHRARPATSAKPAPP